MADGLKIVQGLVEYVLATPGTDLLLVKLRGRSAQVLRGGGRITVEDRVAEPADLVAWVMQRGGEVFATLHPADDIYGAARDAAFSRRGI